MSRSRNHDALIDALFERQVSPEEARRLLGEVPDDEIDELAELVDTLARIDPDTGTAGDDLPGEERFREVRRSVLERIEAARQPAAHPRARWLPLAAALAAFAVGLAVGRGGVEADPVPDLTLADLVTRSAGAADDGTSFRYSNLRLHEVGDDALAVTVDVEAQLDLVRPRGDALVNDILSRSLESDASLGARLKAVRHAGSSPRFRSALTTAVLADPDVSVRLKALERLVAEDGASAETQETLLTVLAEEQSVAMRLLALEAIQDDYLEPEVLEGLDPNDDDEGAVLWHARQRLGRRSL